MQQLLQDLTSYDEDVRSRAVSALRRIGEPAFTGVAALLHHEVAKWEIVSLLPDLSIEKSIPLLLEVLNHEREKSVREREHAKKYMRIRAIEALGQLGETATRDTLALFARYKVEEALGYFINPAHPHLHEEVTEAVARNLRRIATPTAIRLVERWQK